MELLAVLEQTASTAPYHSHIMYRHFIMRLSDFHKNVQNLAMHKVSN